MATAEERKQKIKEWFKDSHNKIFCIIFLFAIVLNSVYFLKTYQQPVWWDEGEYLSMAKSFAYDIPFNFNRQRPIFFPALVSFLYLFGASETIVRLIAIFLPALGVVITAYLLGSILYNKKTGLIFSFLFSAFWVSIFNTTRIHTDMLALLFGLLSLYAFWKWYVIEKNNKLLWLLGIFLALGFMTRVQNALLGVGILIYILVTEHYKWALRKELWIAFLVMLVAISPLIIWNINKFDTPLAQTSGYITGKSLEEKSQNPIAWNVLEIFPLFFLPGNNLFGIIMVILFLMGMAMLFNIFLGFDLLIKNKDEKLNADFFTILLLLISMLYFMFIERPSVYGYDPKWLMFSAAAMFLIAARGASRLHEILSKHMQKLSAAIVAIILIIAIIPQFIYATNLINEKKDSYLQVKLADLWLKENTSPSEVIYSHSSTQTTYYSERHTKGIPPTYEDFVKDQKEDRARFFTVSIFEKHPEWAYSYPQQHPDEFTPVMAYELNKDQPALVIYQYNPSASNPSSAQNTINSSPESSNKTD